VNRAGANYCRNCGEQLGAVSSNQAKPPKFSPALEIANRVDAAGRLITDERKRVTVLFADIRGSTVFIEKLDPEEVRKHFDPVLRVMTDAVHRYGGTVNQVLGDGIMALFGAPVAHEDHAVRACYAALAMQEAMRRGGVDAGMAAGALRIGIGLNSGEVVMRSVTNDLNFDYSALGQTTHLAARMEALAGPGKIVITAETRRDAEGFVDVTPLGAHAVKGFSIDIEAFELTGVTGARSRLQAATTRGLTSFVGRQNELEVAQRLIGQIANGHGQMLAIVGEAGIGKSRLLKQFLAQCVPAEFAVLEAPSVSYGKMSPYFPIIRLLQSYFGVSEGDVAENVRAKVAERLLELDTALNDSIPPILGLLDALPSKPQGERETEFESMQLSTELAATITQYTGTEPQERRRRMLGALTRLLLTESSRQPLFVIFEDLHWIDSETEAFLDELVDKLTHGRIFLWVNYRPGYSHTWANRDCYNRLRLTPLQAEDASQLLDSLLGDDGDLAKLKEVLARRTAGNPFFVEESVRSLVEAGVLVGSKGNYRSAVLTESVRIPNTVQTVLAERIDRLPAEDKQLLQTASVIGTAIPQRLLRAVSGLAEEEFRRAIGSLQTGEFLVETVLYPELVYKFTHALINDVVYGALLREHRVALHTQTVAALEAMAAEHRLDEIEALADHAFRGELWEKAAVYLRQAGNKAMSHSAFDEALTSYERAFEALAHLPESKRKLAQQIDLHLDCRNVLFVRGDLSRVGEQLAQAEALAERLGDERRLARVLNFQCSHYGLVGDPDRAIEAGHRVLSLPITQQDPSLIAVTRYYVGVAYNKASQYDRAALILRAGMESVTGDLIYKQFGTAVILSAIYRSHLAQSLTMTGEFEEGIEHGQEGMRIADAANHPLSQIHVNSSLGFLFLLKGDFAEAIPALERALALCEDKHIPIYIPLVSPRLGYAYVNMHRQEEGLRLIERSIEDFANVGRASFLALNVIWLAETYLVAGRFEDAAALMAQAVKLAKQHKEDGHLALALKLCGDIARQRTPNDLEQGESYYRQALESACALGMRPLQAHCHAGLGKLHLLTGSPDQARFEFNSALELYRSMEMNFWIPDTEKCLAQLR
jgi:class 3 adenylate cyclase/tetratricopeptide (TPR) repeat protein